jgi:hypothetical protein
VPAIVKHEKPALSTQLRRARESSDAEPALYLAVVHADDGVRFMTVASSRRDLIHRVAEYVRKWGGYLLRPDHARHLRSLLLRGESEAAVELYFALVGKRWDKEWLVTAVVSKDAPEQCAAVLGEVALPDALGGKRGDASASNGDDVDDVDDDELDRVSDGDRFAERRRPA